MDRWWCPNDTRGGSRTRPRAGRAGAAGPSRAAQRQQPSSRVSSPAVWRLARWAPWRPPAHGAHRCTTELLHQPARTRCTRGRPDCTATRSRACCSSRDGGTLRRQAAQVSWQETVCIAWLEQQGSRAGFSSRLLTLPAAPSASPLPQLRAATQTSHLRTTVRSVKRCSASPQRQRSAVYGSRRSSMKWLRRCVLCFSVCVASCLTACRRRRLLALPRALSPSAKRRRSGASPGVS